MYSNFLVDMYDVHFVDVKYTRIAIITNKIAGIVNGRSARKLCAKDQNNVWFLGDVASLIRQ